MLSLSCFTRVPHVTFEPPVPLLLYELHFYQIIKLLSEDKQLSSLYMRCKMEMGHENKAHPHDFFRTSITTDNINCIVSSFNGHICNSRCQLFQN